MMGSAITIAENEDATGSASTSLGQRGSSIETQQPARLPHLLVGNLREAPGSLHVRDEILTEFSSPPAVVVDPMYTLKKALYNSGWEHRGWAHPDPILEPRPPLGQSHPDYAQEAAGSDADLEAALADLGEIAEEAREQGFPEPSRETIDLADRLLRRMYKTRPCLLGIYPTQDGEVTIHAARRPGNSVRVLCHAADGVMCLVNLGGRQHRRGVYMPVATSSASLRNFVQEALDDLGSER